MVLEDWTHLDEQTDEETGCSDETGCSEDVQAQSQRVRVSFRTVGAVLGVACFLVVVALRFSSRVAVQYQYETVKGAMLDTIEESSGLPYINGSQWITLQSKQTGHMLWFNVTGRSLWGVASEAQCRGRGGHEDKFQLAKTDGSTSSIKHGDHVNIISRDGYFLQSEDKPGYDVRPVATDSPDRKQTWVVVCYLCDDAGSKGIRVGSIIYLESRQTGQQLQCTPDKVNPSLNEHWCNGAGCTWQQFVIKDATDTLAERPSHSETK
eukprot:TRINITY_DN13185_c0_g1_i1.p1 TRINITY_DN13185_c0_g1~~TRINITY_DN13185_c0_g1_i1.p1  ORF type:complete len:265 (+),score=37.36 TRINITY_DN13185_c0_g1_i1:74-868(+)